MAAAIKQKRTFALRLLSLFFPPEKDRNPLFLDLNDSNHRPGFEWPIRRANMRAYNENRSKSGNVLSAHALLESAETDTASLRGITPTSEQALRSDIVVSDRLKSPLSYCSGQSFLIFAFSSACMLLAMAPHSSTGINSGNRATSFF